MSIVLVLNMEKINSEILKLLKENFSFFTWVNGENYAIELIINTNLFVIGELLEILSLTQSFSDWTVYLEDYKIIESMKGLEELILIDELTNMDQKNYKMVTL